MKGVSQLISAVMLIVVTIAIMGLIAPWALNIARTSTNQTSGNIDMQLLCQNIGYDFDNNYGTSGIVWNFTGSNTTLKAKITNTGTINVYGFIFDITINNSLIYEVYANSTSQKTQANPLKPGQSAILEMNITSDYNDTLTDVRIRNSVCPSVSISQLV
jgi:lipopolysaccharide export LptBFGC system permease protein LptF